ncbi:S16 family serine protease [Palaeococcus ferrophilus]|uniref:S16 family serine protease n=1 Tax=Palaeococcus ferrophilus TaxID=83868 RepID=UPI00064E583B|nr:S16 family serine protease [Palaeococcus ferrophilus]
MKRVLGVLAVLMVALSLATPSLAQCPAEGNTVYIKAPAVSRTASGELVGVATTFSITVAPGSGHVYVETWPLTEVDMQASARLAAQIAGKVLGVDMSKYDVFIHVASDAPTIGGPSAGGTMTVGIIAALKGWKLRDDVMMTGMINPDGSIGPVGGILEKASAAHDAGMSVFLIPEGQRIQMVQHTEKSQIGPLVQITSKAEPVDVVEYAKERWGLQVVEIKDIYDAIFYFTGHRIERPKAPESISIDTSFVKDDALRDYDNTTAYYSLVEKELNDSDVGYSTYNLLKGALNQAKEKIDSAKENIDKGRYYTAMSLDFQARITIRTVEWSLKADTPEKVEDLLRSVESDIKEMENQSYTIRGVTMLQAIAGSEERVEEAKEYMKDAWSAYYQSDYWNAIGNAAFAYERLQTAKFWALLGQRYAKGDVISPEVVRDTARNYLDNTRLVVTYISSMFGEANVGDLVKELDKGEEYYSEGKYSAALFSAIEASARANILLDTIGIENETVLTKKLEEMKKDAEVAIATAQSKGVYPLLGVAYYEFAQSYEEQGGLENLVTAMTFYQYAKESSTIFLSSTITPKVEDITPEVPPITTVTTTTTATESEKRPATPERSQPVLLAGALIVGLLFGIGIGRKL